MESTTTTSIMTYSMRFIEFLKDIKSPVAEKLLNLQNKDTDSFLNYIDLDLSKEDIITFFPESKLKDKKINLIMGVEDSSFNYDCVLEQAISSGKLGIDRNISIKFPLKGTKGSIERELTLDEVISLYPRQDGTIREIFTRVGPLVLFKWIEHKISGSFTTYPCCEITYIRYSVIGKNALWPDFKELYKNEMKVGRFVKKLLGDQLTDKEIEDFVNKYKSMVQITNNAFLRLKIVKEEDIRKYYQWDKYDGGSGVLNNSCMRGENCQPFFDIYAKNPEVVSMVVLMSKKDNDTISGRAILWTDIRGRRIMDRIYVNKCSDEELFKEMAIKEGFFYKENQNYTNNQLLFNGVSLDTEDNKVYIKLNPDIKYEKFPYLDTMKFYDSDKQILSSCEEGFNIILSDTGGGSRYC